MSRETPIAAKRRPGESSRRPARIIPPCEERCDLAGGFLDSEQRLRWTGPLPPADVLAHLPDTMDRLHFAAVSRSVGGLIRCELRPDGVDCRLLGRWPALLFAEPEKDVSTRRVVRRWRITGGGLARPETALGMITFGWEAGEEMPDGTGQTLWVRVEGYPSRFIRRAGKRGLPWLPGPVSILYARYHGIVTCRYLRRMAAWMMERADEVRAEEIGG